MSFSVIVRDRRTYKEVSREVSNAKVAQFVELCISELRSDPTLSWDIKCDLLQEAMKALQVRFKSPYWIPPNRYPPIGLGGNYEYKLPWRDVYETGEGGFIRGSAVWLADGYFKHSTNPEFQKRVVRELCRILVLGDLTGWATNRIEVNSITSSHLASSSRLLIEDPENRLERITGKKEREEYLNSLAGPKNLLFGEHSHKASAFVYKSPIFVEGFVLSMPFSINRKAQEAYFEFWGQLQFRREGKQAYERVPRAVIEDSQASQEFWDLVWFWIQELRKNPDAPDLEFATSLPQENQADSPKFSDRVELAQRTRNYPQKHAASLIGIGYTTLRDDRKRDPSKQRYPVQYVGSSTLITGDSLYQLQIQMYCGGVNPSGDRIHFSPEGKTYLLL